MQKNEGLVKNRSFAQVFFHQLAANKNANVKTGLEHLALLALIRGYSTSGTAAGCVLGAGQLAERLDLAPNTVKRKLKQLESWGLVVTLDIKHHTNHGVFRYAAPVSEVDLAVQYDTPSAWAPLAREEYKNAPRLLPVEVAKLLARFIPTEEQRAAFEAQQSTKKQTEEQRAEVKRGSVDVVPSIEATLNRPANRHDARTAHRKNQNAQIIEQSEAVHFGSTMKPPGYALEQPTEPNQPSQPAQPSEATQYAGRVPDWWADNSENRAKTWNLFELWCENSAAPGKKARASQKQAVGLMAWQECHENPAIFINSAEEAIINGWRKIYCKVPPEIKQEFWVKRALNGYTRSQENQGNGGNGGRKTLSTPCRAKTESQIDELYNRY